MHTAIGPRTMSRLRIPAGTPPGRATERVIEGDWRRTDMGYSHYPNRKLAPLIDIVSAVLALEGALIATNFEYMPSGFAAFLAMRITVKNLLLLGFFLTGWHVVFLCCRVYEQGPVPPLAR